MQHNIFRELYSEKIYQNSKPQLTVTCSVHKHSVQYSSRRIPCTEEFANNEYRYLYCECVKQLIFNSKRLLIMVYNVSRDAAEFFFILKGLSFEN